MLSKDQIEVNTIGGKNSSNWEDMLCVRVGQEFAAGQQDILAKATPEFERILLECALELTGGRKQEADGY